MKEEQNNKQNNNMEQNNMEIAVIIGLGYVGFPLACAIAKTNEYEVYGIDIDPTKIEKINKKISPVKDEYAEKAIKECIVNATADSSIIEKAKYIIICVPTPIDEHKNPDLSPVKEAAQMIAKHLKKGQLIVLESTVNPGVCEEVVLPILERTGLKGGLDFDFAHCPERINPKDKKWNVENINRNVGGLNIKSTKLAAEFYRSFLKASVNEVSSIKVAEATKIVENTFRDVNIAFVNEIAQCFDKLNIDTIEVLDGAANKPFGFLLHYPGVGVGGHCIPVDPYYLIKKAEEYGFDCKLMKMAREINNNMPKYTVNKLVDAMNDSGLSIKGAKIGLLGLSYKGDIYDLRESPSLEVKRELVNLGANVMTYDPYCPGASESELNRILENCTAIIVASNHTPFKRIYDWKNVKIIIDGRNCINKAQISSDMFYYSIGKGFDLEKPIENKPILAKQPLMSPVNMGENLGIANLEPNMGQNYRPLFPEDKRVKLVFENF